MTVQLWAEYARVQKLVECGRARDEQLDAILKRHFDEGHQFDLYESRRRHKNLDRNLPRKDRLRKALLRRHVANFKRVPPLSPLSELVLSEACKAVRISAGENWDLLRATVESSYEIVARKMNIPIGTLKSTVSRYRSKLRKVLYKRAGAG